MKYLASFGGSFSIQDVVYLPTEADDASCHAQYGYDGIITIPNVSECG